MRDHEQEVVGEKVHELGRIFTIKEEEYVKLQVEKVVKIVDDYPIVRQCQDVAESHQEQEAEDP